MQWIAKHKWMTRRGATEEKTKSKISGKERPVLSCMPVVAARGLQIARKLNVNDLRCIFKQTGKYLQFRNTSSWRYSSGATRLSVAD
jgi:hypothetical protein